MKTLRTILDVIFLTLLTQCGVSEKESKSLNNANPQFHPKHIGSGKTGSYQLYDFTVFQNSVSIKAASPDIFVIAAEVYDINYDGKFDSVYILKKGRWIFFTLLNHDGDGDEKTSTLCNYIGFANHARNITK